MAHPNERIVRTQVERFIAGDMEGWLDTVTEDLTVHVPPGHQLSGDYHGSQEFVNRFIARVMELTGGVHVDIHDILASDEHGVGLYRIRTQRSGSNYEWSHTNVYHFREGKISEIWWNPYDEQKVASVFS